MLTTSQFGFEVSSPQLFDTGGSLGCVSFKTFRRLLQLWERKCWQRSQNWLALFSLYLEWFLILHNVSKVFIVVKALNQTFNLHNWQTVLCRTLFDQITSTCALACSRWVSQSKKNWREWGSPSHKNKTFQWNLLIQTQCATGWRN